MVYQKHRVMPGLVIGFFRLQERYQPNRQVMPKAWMGITPVMETVEVLPVLPAIISILSFFRTDGLQCLFVPYPYASGLQAKQINQVFEDAKKQTTSAAYLKGKFAGLTESVTLHFERYGYLENRIVFECGSLSPCTINTAEGYLNLIKPGVINEHIIKYSHIATP